MISENVTTDGAGNATFTMALQYDDIIAYFGGYDLNDFSLTVGSTAITLVSSSTPLTAGHIYNITRSAVTLPEGALSGKFTINESGKQVYFSKGNLRASYNTSWSWSFFPNQWDYVGNASANNNITGNGTVNVSSDYLYVDLFNWSTEANYYGITNSFKYSDFSGDLVDWGNTIGSGWHLLTKDEWDYLFSTRVTGGTVGETSQARYTMSTIRTDVTGVNGVILFPDGVNLESSEFTTLGTVNGISAWGTKCTSAQWTALAAKGCVFLPAAGYRSISSVEYAGYAGQYWSSSPYDENSAYTVGFERDYLEFKKHYHDLGYSVRLAYEVE